MATSTSSRAQRGEFDVACHDAGDGSIRVALSGELDLATAGEFEHALATAGESGARSVIVDLRSLDFIDSTGLRLIIQFDERARAAGIDMEIWSGPPAVSRVFEISGAREHLPFGTPR